MNSQIGVTKTSAGAHEVGVLVRLCCTVFISGITYGAYLPVVSLLVQSKLGFGDVITGTVVGLHFLATLLTRGYAGRLTDRIGARAAMFRGLVLCSCAGIFLALSSSVEGERFVGLALIAIGRVCSGISESMVITAALSWGVGLAGAERAGRVMAWNGMALYGAIALGAPCGIAVMHLGGTGLLGGVAALMPAAAIAAICSLKSTCVEGGNRLDFLAVLAAVWRGGATLALQGVGFAAISSFVPLYFLKNGWQNPGFALSAFGGAFVLARVLFGSLPDRLGGYRVALGALAVESIGQLLMLFAPSGIVAVLGAAITGFGCSLVFPALGALIVRRMPLRDRALTIGLFTAFQDVSYFATGPIAGVVATRLGYSAVYGLGTLAAFAGACLLLRSRTR